MPNEIYHRSNWGESKAEDFGDVYYDHAATNKLYNHSDYYENSDGTDATLKDLNNKASIVLTPTAYSDGSLNTVIPPYQVLPTELVTNGTFDTDSDWIKGTGWTIANGKASFDGGSDSAIQQDGVSVSGKKYSVSIEVLDRTTGSLQLRFGSSGSVDATITENGVYNYTLIADGTRVYLRSISGFDGSIDNVSVKEIQEADFDFSRGSSATRVNEQGLVEDVQILSGELVQNGNFEQIGSELVTNGDFSDGLNSWGTSSTNPVVLVDGGVRMQSDGVIGSFIKQSGILTLNNFYKLVFEVKEVQQSGSLKVGFAGSGVAQASITEIGIYTLYFKSAGTQFELVRKSAINVIIDNVSVKEVGQNWTFGTGWSMGDGKAVSDGSQTGTSFLFQLYSFTSGKKYRVAYDIEVTSGSIFSRLAGGGSTVDGNTQTASGTYTDDLVASVNHTNISFGASSDFVGSIDNISIKEVTDDTDLPRIDFTDGTGSLLLEPQRTNLLERSNEFDNTYWDKFDITVTANAAISPDGTNNAFLLDVGTDNDDHSLRKSNLSPTSTYTASIFAKKGSTDYVWFVCGGASKGIQAIFDLSDGSVTDSGTVGSGQTLVAASSVNMGNGWYRLILQGETTSPPQNNVTITPYYQSTFSGNINTSWQGNNETIYIYGAMNEEGSFATSYIPTESSTVTRSADVANNSGNADLFNDSEGVLYAEIAALADDGTKRRIAISDGTANNRIVLGYFTDNSIQSFGSVTTSQFNLFDTSTNINSFNKCAIKYKQNDFALWVNGIEVATDLSGNTPTGLKELAFDDGNGSDDFIGDVKCVAVFKEALSNDLLERLTGEGYESFRLLAEANNYTII